MDGIAKEIKALIETNSRDTKRTEIPEAPRMNRYWICAQEDFKLALKHQKSSNGHKEVHKLVDRYSKRQHPGGMDELAEKIAGMYDKAYITKRKLRVYRGVGLKDEEFDLDSILYPNQLISTTISPIIGLYFAEGASSDQANWSYNSVLQIITIPCGTQIFVASREQEVILHPSTRFKLDCEERVKRDASGHDGPAGRVLYLSLKQI